MQNWAKPFGLALHNIFCFSCGPMEKIIAHPCFRTCLVISLYKQNGVTKLTFCGCIHVFSELIELITSLRTIFISIIIASALAWRMF